MSLHIQRTTIESRTCSKKCQRQATNDGNTRQERTVTAENGRKRLHHGLRQRGTGLSPPCTMQCMPPQNLRLRQGFMATRQLPLEVPGQCLWYANYADIQGLPGIASILQGIEAFPEERLKCALCQITRRQQFYGKAPKSLSWTQRAVTHLRQW